MTRKKVIGLICISVITLFAVAMLVYKPYGEKKMKPITKDELFYKIKNEEQFCVYVGRGDCPDCIVFSPTLERVIREEKFAEQIFYFDVEEIRKSLNDEEWREFKDGLSFTQTPALLAIQSGRVNAVIEWSEDGLEYDDVVKWMKTNGITK